MKITKSHIGVQFDHMNSPYDVEMVTSKFIVMKNFYVCRKQFPLILASAITIHKNQRLSLDSSVIDLSEKVFGAGMAYVALSRVRNLSGLHLIKFHPNSVIVSRKCILELNIDLDSCTDPICHCMTSLQREQSNPVIGVASPHSLEKLLLVICRIGLVETKDGVLQNNPMKNHLVRRNDNRRPLPLWLELLVKKEPVIPTWMMLLSQMKRLCRRWHNPTMIVLKRVLFLTMLNAIGAFFCVDKQCQRRACAKLGVQFHNFNRLRPGGPDACRLRRSSGDGNCLFRSFSYIITGSESGHLAIRRAILRHMVDIAHLLLGGHLTNYDSVDEYVQATGMDKDRTWGTEGDMMTLPHLLQTPLYAYNVPRQQWMCYTPSTLKRIARPVDNTHIDSVQMGMYIYHTTAHFEVVSAVL